jgi:serine/threonine-protein kinase
MSDPRKPEDKLTQSGVALGTPYYMAPEQALGQKDLDHRVDVYAAGVILYECLTGELPFKAVNLYALVRRIVDAPLVPPGELREGLPEGLEAVVLKALARERDERYGSAAEMLLSLFPFMDEAAAARVSLPEGMEAKVDRSTPRSGSAAFAPGALRGPASGPGRLRTGPRTTKRRAGLVAAVAALVLGGVAALIFAIAGRGSDAAPGDDAREPGIGDVQDRGGAAAASQDSGPRAEAGRADERAGEPATVTITLEGVPDGATVTVDGRPVAGPAFDLRSSGEERTIEVVAEGRAPWQARIVPDRDRRVEVALEPARPTGTGPGRPPRPGRPVKTEGPVEEPAKQPPAKQPPDGQGSDFEEEFRL